MTPTTCPSVLKALADQTRWRIVQTLLDQERASVTQLAAQLRLTQPNVSKHLRILRGAGIVVSEKEATIVWCSVEPDFRQRLRSGEATLDLGCCTFRFDLPAL